MAKIYRDAELYIAPSKPRIITRFGTPMKTWEEQYGVALMEAQASGLPIITTRSGAIPENVGDAARLVTPGDSKALARAIKEFLLIPNLRAEFGARARSRAITVHDALVGARLMKDLYQTVLSS